MHVFYEVVSPQADPCLVCLQLTVGTRYAAAVNNSRTATAVPTDAISSSIVDNNTRVNLGNFVVSVILCWSQIDQFNDKVLTRC